MHRRRSTTQRTLRPLEDSLNALSGLNLLTQAALLGFAWMHNQHNVLTGDTWRRFCQETSMPFSMRFAFDLAMEHTAEQARKGFPTFLGMVAVSIASILEAGIRDFARQWLRDHAASWEQDAVNRIELPATSFSRMPHADRCETLLTQLELSLRSSSSGRAVRPGIEPLQRLLGAIGVAPKPQKSVVAAINELVAVRNQLLHHGGRINARFLELCPHLKRGRHVKVTDVMLESYFSAAEEYLEEVGVRAREVAGLDE